MLVFCKHARSHLTTNQKRGHASGASLLKSTQNISILTQIRLPVIFYLQTKDHEVFSKAQCLLINIIVNKQRNDHH